MIRFTNKQWLYIIFVSLVLTLGGSLAFWLYKTRTQVDLTTFIVATLSALISLVALFVALQTYLSIDSVNNITKMDGNILDNENYVTSIPEFVDKYKETDREKLCRHIFSEVKQNLKKNSNTAVNFADTIQGMIDILVLLPALDLKAELRNKEFRRDVQWILNQVERRAEEIQSISKGSSIQIREAVKLFLSVYEYQISVENKRMLGSSGLLKVRAAMIRNPVSSTVYYNYLGLYYRKCAVQVIDSTDKADIPTLKSWAYRKVLLSGGESERLRRYLNNSINSFQKAWGYSSEDPMWRGYILFNQARVAFIEHVFFGDSHADPFEKMAEAINARATLNELISEVLGDRDELTVLQKHYLYQEEYARELLVNYNLTMNDQAFYRGMLMRSTEEYLETIAPYISQLEPKNQAGLEAIRAGLEIPRQVT
ncbi:hypothetical protein [Marinobacter sp. AN1]|uniref:hypothetical protein n=1 Tax=Marinobacter sp. AN1 TaxID=2886046 RepID=UPI0022323DE6|nr:hypothetical protein [Marinobacter sp. AN1]UZD64621.1 hypothetical protein LJ360_13495 [Marinobacter sp. AN1]